ncbi:uncharacterized protein LOC125029626 [Penaeus chinensis]|uniref:uncharacterized protein LOC125029626 n=1 Tax=Penaeus chinensis TaxID=139456 RepID=UPI001FB796A1|nr:uncharacterized protein LOC125029626 [Penaeus chinensis]
MSQEGEMGSEMNENLEDMSCTAWEKSLSISPPTTVSCISAPCEEDVDLGVGDVKTCISGSDNKEVRRKKLHHRRFTVPVVTADMQEAVANQSEDIRMDSKAEMFAETLQVPVTQRLLHLKYDELSYADTESESIVDASLMSGSDSQSAALRPTKMKKKLKKFKSMKLKRDGRDSDSSVSSRRRGSTRRALVKCKFLPEGLAYIESSLKGRIFSGWVDERKWVENLGSYRDIVEVDEWEVDFNKQLNIIIRKIPGVQEGTRWINITAPTAIQLSYCLWVLLFQPPIPGHYWFVITGVAVQPLFGLKISLQIVRSIDPQDYETAEARSKRRQMSSSELGHELETISQQFMDWWDQVRQLNFALVWSAITATFTISNILEAVRFCIILVITLIVGLVTLLRDSHHLVLGVIHEAGIFFRNLRPFLQSVVVFAEKLIGALYLLIAMVYRDWKQPSTRSASPSPVTKDTLQPPKSGHPHLPTSPLAVPRAVRYVPPQQWVYKRQISNPLN